MKIALIAQAIVSSRKISANTPNTAPAATAAVPRARLVTFSATSALASSTSSRTSTLIRSETSVTAVAMFSGLVLFVTARRLRIRASTNPAGKRAAHQDLRPVVGQAARGVGVWGHRYRRRDRRDRGRRWRRSHRRRRLDHGRGFRRLGDRRRLRRRRRRIGARGRLSGVHGVAGVAHSGGSSSKSAARSSSPRATRRCSRARRSGQQSRPDQSLDQGALRHTR